MQYAKVDHGVWCIRPDGHFLEEVVVFSPSGGRASPYLHTNMPDKTVEEVTPEVSYNDNWKEFRSNLERKGFTVLSDDPTEADIDLILRMLGARYREGLWNIQEKQALEFYRYRDLDEDDPQRLLCEKRIAALSTILAREKQRFPLTRQEIADYLSQRSRLPLQP